MLAALVFALSSTLSLAASGREHVGLAAGVEQVRGGEADVVVSFMPLDGAIRVNAEPAPRLALDPEQPALAESSRAAPPLPRAGFPNGRYLDTRAGVRFPVRLARGAARGRHTVHARVTYFYCSQTEGWCRRAQDDVEFSVDVP